MSAHVTQKNALLCCYEDGFSTKHYGMINADIASNCPSGYAEKHVEGTGHVPGIQCPVPCTDEQMQDCTKSTYEHRREQRANSPSKSLRGEALLRCRIFSPITMLKEAYVDRTTNISGK